MTRAPLGDKCQKVFRMFYVYELQDPRKNNQPFYIGKGKGNRASTHLWKIPATRNVYKENIIKAIRKENLEPIIFYVKIDIINEDDAYELESLLIKKYGRKGYDPDGILSNICLDSRPPNHKGKSYEEIYGSKERADLQRKKRADLQKIRGGYGPKKRSQKTKELLHQKYSGLLNPERYEYPESDLLKIGKEFCSYFNNVISLKKWHFWCKKNNIPFMHRTFRFNYRYLLDVFSEEFNAHNKCESQLWFYNPSTYENFRCSQWELDENCVQIPHEFIKGRGKVKK